MSASEMRLEQHGDRVMRCCAQRPVNVVEMLRQSFSRAADALAVVGGDTRVSYRELDAGADTLAIHLAQRGVKPGDRIAVMLPNTIDAVLAVMVIARLGAVVVPIGTRLRQAEIANIFDDAQPLAVIHAAAFRAELPPTGPAAHMRFECGSADWAALLAPSTVAHTTLAAPHPAIDEDDTFAVLYTSGTTGRPKGVLLTHLHVVHSCLHWQQAHRLARAERTLLAIPWSHVAGLCGVVLPFLHLGGTLVLMADFKRADFKRREFLSLAEREQIIHALMVPAIVGLCLLEPDPEVLGERVLAFLNVAADLDEAHVRAFCAERMADYKVPGRVVIGREALPRNANGKIQKAELRALALTLTLPPLAMRAR